MLRYLVAAFIGLMPLAAQAQVQEQALVDRAALTVQDLLTAPRSSDRLNALRNARAVMICPRVFRAAFFFGGAGSDCVLVARDGAGSWSSPAFYSLASGSFGLQFGVQDSEVMMMIMTDRGFQAIMDKQFKIGGDAAVAFAVYGAGIEGDTTAALRADVVAFSQDRGLFAGVALNGSMLTTDTDANRAYYGQPYAARQIVVQMQANNPGADPLRAMLAKWGGAGATPPVAAAQPYPYAPQQPPTGYGGGYAPQPPSRPTPLAPVQQQNLPPPSYSRHY